MSETSVTEKRNNAQGAFPEPVVYPALLERHKTTMITTGEILARLQEMFAAGEVTKTAIADAAGIGKNRVSELFGSGTGRKLSHDEAVRLVEAFALEPQPVPRVSPIPPAIARLVVLYIAEELGVSLEQRAAQLGELAEDVRAFAEYVADPVVRDRLDLAEEFFRVMRIRRSAPQEAARRENGPQKTH